MLHSIEFFYITWHFGMYGMSEWGETIKDAHGIKHLMDYIVIDIAELKIILISVFFVACLVFESW
jgi:hypothetical protein